MKKQIENEEGSGSFLNKVKEKKDYAFYFVIAFLVLVIIASNN